MWRAKPTKNEYIEIDGTGLDNPNGGNTTYPKTQSEFEIIPDDAEKGDQDVFDDNIPPITGQTPVVFRGNASKKRAYYFCIKFDEDEGRLHRMMVQNWQFDKRTELLISVVGEEEKLSISENVSKSLKHGLQEITLKTKTLIVTGGCDSGIMKFVGKAVGGRPTKVKLLGVVEWKRVSGRKSSLTKASWASYSVYPPPDNVIKPGEILLDSNHTHFVLVGDGSRKTTQEAVKNQEVRYRAKLEKYVQQKLDTNVVQIVVGGDATTIEQITACLTGSNESIIPVVIVNDSGAAANLISLAYSLQITGVHSYHFTAVKDEVVLFNKIESHFPEQNKSQRMKTYQNILSCMQMRQYITICNAETKEDLEEAILRALMTVNERDEEGKTALTVSQLNLALHWNLRDIAGQFIPPIKATGDNLMKESMYNALLQGNRNFVELLLLNGFDMESFLTYGMLEKLYVKTLGENDKLAQFLIKTTSKKIYKMMKNRDTDYLKLHHIKKGLVYLLDMDVMPHYNEYKLNEKFMYPFNDLFIWAVVSNLNDLALFLWEHDDEAIAKALVARKITMELALCYQNEQDASYDAVKRTIENSAKAFGERAVGVLQECYKSDHALTESLLKTESQRWGNENCMNLAVACKLEEFIGHISCQEISYKKWKSGLAFFGRYEAIQVMLGIVSAPVAWYYMKQLDPNKSIESKSNEHEEEDNQKSRFPKLANFARFYTLPVTKYWINFMFHLAFLFLFASVALQKLANKPTSTEWILFTYVLSCTMDEIRQIWESSKNKTCLGKFRLWWSSIWNKLDSICIPLFFVAIGLRMSGAPKVARIGQVVYALDLMLWVVRLLDVFTVSKRLGPYVVMIHRMLGDLFNFLAIISIFMLAYGIGRYSVLMPYDEISWKTIRYLVTMPYFGMYNNMFMSIPPKANQTIFSTPYTEDSEFEEPIVIVILGIFLIFTSVMLVSILVAIFNNTYREVQIRSERVWKAQWYYLVETYDQRPPLPPPFIMIWHVISLIQFLVNLCNKTRPLDYQEQYKSEEMFEIMKMEEDSMNTYIENVEKGVHDSPDEKLEYLKEKCNRLEEMVGESQSKIDSLTDRILKKAQKAKIRLRRIQSINTETKVVEREKDEEDSSEKKWKAATTELVLHQDDKQAKQRSNVYPLSQIKRFVVGEEFLSWKIAYPDYDPVAYTALNVLAGCSLSVDEEYNPRKPPKFNELDEACDRRSYKGPYELDPMIGLPLNPSGRTGIKGRGMLRRYGPNHITEAIFTRFRAFNQSTKHQLLEVLVLEESAREYYLPSDEVKLGINPEDNLPNSLKKIFNISTLKQLKLSDHAISKSMEALRGVMINRQVIYEGFLDDERNTDNAWIETAVYNYHLAREELSVGKFFLNEKKLKESKLKWMKLTENTPLLEHDKLWYLKEVAKHHGGFFSERK